MARLPRLDAPDLPQHISQRGNNRTVWFFHLDDDHLYLTALDAAAQKQACRLHAYVLMTNHAHCLLTGSQRDTASALIRALGRREVRAINRTYQRTGTLWEGRLKSSIVESERSVLTYYRQVELHSMRAGLVRGPGAYRWSSDRHQALGELHGLIQDHDVYRA